MEYKYNDNTLIHAIGFNLYKLLSIEEKGILSYEEASKQNIKLARSFNGYNLKDTVSVVRYGYLNPSDDDSSYNRFIKNGISLLIENEKFIYDKDERYIDHSDEVLVPNKVSKENIKGISIPSIYMNELLLDLPMINLKSFNYINIKENTKELLKLSKYLGYELNKEEKLEYNNLIHSLSISLEERLRNRENKEKEEVANEDKISLADFMSYIVNKSFEKKLNKKNITLLEAVKYINSINTNLPIYINYNITKAKRR